MVFPNWPRPERGVRRLRHASVARSEIDPDEWAEMANGGVPDESADEPLDRQSLEVVTRRLLEVLADESATMIPPSAEGLDQEQWSSLAPRERFRFARKQLSSLDPRLLSRAILGWTGRRSLTRR